MLVTMAELPQLRDGCWLGPRLGLALGVDAGGLAVRSRRMRGAVQSLERGARGVGACAEIQARGVARTGCGMAARAAWVAEAERLDDVGLCWASS